MASQTSIDLVIANLPSWREDLTDWDESKIGDTLDLLSGNVNMVCRQFWIQRVSDTQPLTDINESGSSSPQSQNHEHAVAMLAYWDNNIAKGSYSKVSQIKRRYKRPRGYVPVDDYGYGGVYVRTD